MSKKENITKHQFGTTEFLEHARFAIGEQCSQLDKGVKSLDSSNLKDFSESGLLFHSVWSSGVTFAILMHFLRYRDCYPIARTILETAINAMYLAAVPGIGEQDAIPHAIQKNFRRGKFQFEFRHSDVKVEPVNHTEVSENSALGNALAKYTSKKGREITSWSPESIEKRIDEIETWLGAGPGDQLRFAYKTIYPIASEVAHGTLYSHLHFSGAFDIPQEFRNSKIVSDFQNGLICTLALQTAMTINFCVQALAKIMDDVELRNSATTELNTFIDSIEFTDIIK